MNTTASRVTRKDFTRYQPSLEAPDFPLVESDGVPLESYWHYWQILILNEIFTVHFKGRYQFCWGGNIFLYFNKDQARNLDYRGPDFFFVKGVDRRRKRKFWAIWDEGGRFPNVIWEIMSPSTVREDRTAKKDLYEKIFKTPEYFLYDFDKEKIEGWRLDAGGKYRAIAADEQGRLWSEQLEMALGVWRGRFQDTVVPWLRLYDASGALLPIKEEFHLQKMAKAKKRTAKIRQRAAAEQTRAAAEQSRAEAAEAEVAKLKEQLKKLERGKNGK